MTSSPAPRARRVILSIVAGAAALGSLAGCSSYQAWAVTYEVSVTGTSSPDLTDVSYAEADGRNAPSVLIELADADATGSPAVWSQEAIVTAAAWSHVTATPAADGIATCRILLDGQREIDSQTAAVGQPVTCSIPTPGFE